MTSSSHHFAYSAKLVKYVEFRSVLSRRQESRNASKYNANFVNNYLAGSRVAATGRTYLFDNGF